MNNELQLVTWLKKLWIKLTTMSQIWYRWLGLQYYVTVTATSERVLMCGCWRDVIQSTILGVFKWDEVPCRPYSYRACAETANKRGIPTSNIIREKVYFVYCARQRRLVFDSPWILIRNVLPYNCSTIGLQVYGGMLSITVVLHNEHIRNCSFTCFVWTCKFSCFHKVKNIDRRCLVSGRDKLFALMTANLTERYKNFLNAEFRTIWGWSRREGAAIQQDVHY
jgi:hypothetical protein